jgi:hypothetical protein
MFNAATLAEVRKAERRARAQIRDRKSQSQCDLAPAIAAVETSAAAFAFGCAHGQSGDGMADLWTGAALHAVSFFSEGSWFAPHAQALGNGALAACAYRHGLAAGQRATSARPAAAPSANAAIPGQTSVTLDVTIARLTVTARR